MADHHHTAATATATDRRARIEELRRAERARERRYRIVVLSLSGVLVAGLVGVGAYTLTKRKDGAAGGDGKAAARPTAAADTPIPGERSWDPKKLGRNHVTTPVTYPMTPPVGGDHNPVWLNCSGDVYQEPVPETNAVHSLEHGAVWVTYNDEAPAADVKKLAGKVASTPYSLMSPVRNQDGAIMLTAWGKQVTVDGADDPRVDRFFTRYVQGRQTPEPGAPCTGGVEAR
ncbi:DUF3105 domain-containing protein [Streptomyces sp. LP05-1]|uniref:DUF3105 domain-containing protein n=1 Tax=Streptomyces pyxinae TaxID=2970734 RepID=A0ABT2CNC5_9ACTN|nr:DUF3105 domain-containing protein [Streptomyces sp. LP05-1]MCS0638924.1 DUF3105 domain-containing protein [Streptomyces sp. LP05-1]